MDDDSGVPSYLRLWYEDIIRSPDPLQVSADQLKFREGYTIMFWELRHLLIETYKCDLDKELAFLEEVLKYDTRNELKWEHRRWIVQKFGHDAPRKDLESIKETIHHEADNPLAWAHRQWVFETFGGDWEGEWEDELTYCDEVIREDIFNSFAWDQRYFVVTRSPTLGGLKAMRDKEVSYALDAIAIEPRSECPWTYVRLLYRGDLQSLVTNRWIEEVCVSVFRREKYENKKDGYNTFVVGDLVDGRGSAHALQMVLDLLRLGFTPSQELLDALHALCQSDPRFVDKARKMLEDAKSCL